MESIISLHKNIMSIIMFITIFVTRMLVRAVYIVHVTIIELL
jgi:hypothetical protein